MAPFFSNVASLLVLVVPLMTMRSFAEERRTGTFELLFSYPVTDLDIVIGKFLALCACFALLLTPTVGYFLLLGGLSEGLDARALTVAYLGLCLLGWMFVSMGMLISSLSKSAVMSAILSFSVFLFFWFVGWLGDWLSWESALWLREFWVAGHIRDFSRGVLDTNHVAYYAAASLFFVSVTVLSLETRSWKG
jgi:ABC-2 type transport system permease protein